MNRALGTPLDGNGHLAQSIADILTTPIGTRVMRRDYGSMLMELIDQPLNSITRMLVFAATALAIKTCEPRFRITRVTMSGEYARGELIIGIEGDRTDLPPTNARVALSIPIRRGGATTNAT